MEGVADPHGDDGRGRGRCALRRPYAASVHLNHRIGWALFLASSLLFVAVGVRDGDLLVTAASVLFGLACVLFLLPGPDGAS